MAFLSITVIVLTLNFLMDLGLLNPGSIPKFTWLLRNCHSINGAEL